MNSYLLRAVEACAQGRSVRVETRGETVALPIVPPAPAPVSDPVAEVRAEFDRIEAGLRELAAQQARVAAGLETLATQRRQVRLADGEVLISEPVEGNSR